MYREDLENWLGLFELFVEDDKHQLQPYWLKLKPKIDNWWKAYKTREANDTFDKALAGERMTARAFGGTKGFEGALTQRIKPCEFSIAADKFVGRENEDKLFHAERDKSHYWHQRGIDDSAYAVADNFLSREKKYAMGLHDLSASLLDPTKSVNLQLYKPTRNMFVTFLPAFRGSGSANALESNQGGKKIPSGIARVLRAGS